MKSARTFLSFTDPPLFPLTIRIHFLVRPRLLTRRSAPSRAEGDFPGPSVFRSPQPTAAGGGR